ncbi:MAG: Asp-tRNA(Asn)/Glu-tRNA(Gln) amidotransferase GatCAB subunit A, partial [Myxococcales bacterium]|nr:Asp-tRNA(Asn)/Glu-tRNA(Gln) amidotransferase GatCAB subunit A [Myxococcales bacterium]
MTTSTPPRHLGVLDAEAALKAGTVTSVDLLNDVLGETERVNSSLGAYVHVASENALARAEQADKRRAAGEPLGLLDGIPVAVKDLLITDDMPTTACSRILEGFVAPYRGSVVSKLIEAGAVLVGKTSCDEFAMGSSNESSCFGTVKNPWDPTRIPGGSSGGSAAAVAADLCSAALGTD